MPEPRRPFPVSEVSNGEWIPRPPTARQRVAARLIADACDAAAKRHGMSRHDFLRSSRWPPACRRSGGGDCVLGPRNVPWGTDCERLPQLTAKTKRRILGLNAARLYHIDPHATRHAITADRIVAWRAEAGGARAARSLHAWGPRSRREFFALLRRAERRHAPRLDMAIRPA